MRRISIVGNSGTGKTTLAGIVAARLGLVHVELDALFHQPGWTQTPPEQFRAMVTAALDAAEETSAGSRARGDDGDGDRDGDREGGWVTCGNYSTVLAGLVWARADTVVWLDLPRPVVMRQVIGRTVRRVVTRKELWNTNQEPWQNLYAWAPERNIVRWAWTHHDTYAQRYEAAMTDPHWSELTFIRLRSRGAIDRWVASLPSRTP